MIKAVPTSITSMLPEWGVYAALGFISDNLLDSFMFGFGQKIGLKIETPKEAPPIPMTPPAQGG